MTQPNTTTEALRAKLAEAEATLEAAVSAIAPAWDALNAARREAYALGHDPEEWTAYLEARAACSKASKDSTKAKTAVTRAKTALAIAETGVDPRSAYKPKKYSATLPDGRVVTRKSPRTYTHAIAAPMKDGTGWWVEGWAGSESLAAARVRRLVGYGHKAQAIPAIVA